MVSCNYFDVAVWGGDWRDIIYMLFSCSELFKEPDRSSELGLACGAFFSKFTLDLIVLRLGVEEIRACF